MFHSLIRSSVSCLPGTSLKTKRLKGGVIEEATVSRNVHTTSPTDPILSTGSLEPMPGPGQFIPWGGQQGSLRAWACPCCNPKAEVHPVLRLPWYIRKHLPQHKAGVAPGSRALAQAGLGWAGHQTEQGLLLGKDQGNFPELPHTCAV